MDTAAKKKVQLNEILTIADHLRPLQILSVVARGGKAVSYDVTYAEDKKQKHLLLRSFCANSAEYEHLCRLHAKLGKASHIAKPLYMEDGWLLYDVDPQKQLSEKDFTEQGGKKRSRDDLKAQLDLVRKAALADRKSVV